MTDATADRTPATTRYPLTANPLVEAEVVHALAQRRDRDAEIARRYGVARSSIHIFRKTHAEEIASVERDLYGQIEAMDHLWVADKAARVAEYQRDIERIEELLGDDLAQAMVELLAMAEDDDDRAATLRRIRALAEGRTEQHRTKAQLLRNVAEEMGQLPTKGQVEVVVPVIQATINGVDVEALR